MLSQFEVIIIGGSYAGLSAAMTLGRSMRKVLILDSGDPCNRKVIHSHNFLTHDGVAPAEIAAIARQEVLAYPTIKLKDAKAVKATQQSDFFTIENESGETFTAKKLLFTTGVFDIMPVIPGFAECWGKSIAHCPYCHGYEIRNTNIGILSNGDMAFEFCKMINHWSKSLTLFTNGASTLTYEQENKIRLHNIPVVENEIVLIEHEQGLIQNIIFKDGNSYMIEGLFTKVPFKQKTHLPEAIGCTITKDSFIAVDDFQRTNIKGVYAAGDNATMFRSVSAAVAAGTKAGAFINKELIDETF